MNTGTCFVLVLWTNDNRIAWWVASAVPESGCPGVGRCKINIPEKILYWPTKSH